MLYKKCKRCGKLERIPQRQVLKFDDKMRPLCDYCWNQFKEWFQRPTRSRDKWQRLSG